MANKNALKRKQAKQKKRQILLKKNGKKISSQSNYSSLKRATNKMPVLAFEPEFDTFKINAKDLQDVINSQSKLPDQIDSFFIKNENIPKLINIINDIIQRPSSDIVKINSQTVLKILESSKTLPSITAICVALFLKWRDQYLKLGDKVTIDNIIQAVENYENEWQDYLNIKISNDDPKQIEEKISTHLRGESKRSDENDAMQQFFSLTIQTNTQKYDIVELEDDLSIFLFDYLAEKGIYQPEEISAILVNEFINSWFIQNLNPLPEDIITMKHHLSTISKQLATTKLIAVEEIKLINEQLKTD